MYPFTTRPLAQIFSCNLSNIIYFLSIEDPTEHVEFTKIIKGSGVVLKGTNRALEFLAGANPQAVLNDLKRKRFSSFLSATPLVLIVSFMFHITNTPLISLYSKYFNKEEKTELTYQ